MWDAVYDGKVWPGTFNLFAFLSAHQRRAPWTPCDRRLHPPPKAGHPESVLAAAQRETAFMERTELH